MTEERHALIIASYQYQDPNLRQLVTPARDAESLAQVLQDPDIGGFEVQSPLVNEPVHEVHKAIEAFFTDRKRDDLLLLYYSGHGIKDEDGQLYFTAPDTQCKLLRSTTVSASFVNDVMRLSRSRRQVLLLDCCYSGAFARGILVRADKTIGTREYFEGQGRIVITASDAMQYAFEGDTITGEGSRSVFTYHLLQGLRTGEADLNNDGWISLDELYNYVHDCVTDEMPKQTPSKWVFDMQGDIIIAQNPCWVKPPDPESTRTKIQEIVVRYLLADCYLVEDRWAEAETAYEKAIQNDELLHLLPAAQVSQPIGKSGTGDPFSGSAYALARLGSYKAAVERIEEGATHIIKYALATDRTHLARSNPVDRRAFEMALEQWYHALDTEDQSELNQAREALDAAVARVRASVPEFLKSDGLSFPAIVAATDDVPLICLIATPKGSLALVVLPDHTDLDETQVIWLNDFTTTDLDHLLVERDSEGEIIGGYLLARSTDTDALKPILETMLHVLGQKLVGPLAHSLRRLGLERGIFVPLGRLSTLPLHAARYEGETVPCYFLDEFEITYAPGAWALASARATHSAAKDKLFSSGSAAVGAFVQDEVEAVTHIAAQSPSAPTRVVHELTTTPQSLLNQASTSRYLHLAHGIVVDVNNPLESVVELSEGVTLKLADLLNAVRSKGAQLVTLSAAQPESLALYCFPETSDTFPASFLEAGVAGVVSNLWPTDDLSASLLMKQFYAYHFRDGLSPSAALRRAQRWLREEVTADMAAEICRRRVVSLNVHGTLAYSQALKEQMTYELMDPDNHPFAHPRFWAPFIISGV